MTNNTIFDNNAVTTLASGITAIATTMTVATGEGALFSTIATPDNMYLTLDDSAGNIEIVKVTTHTVASDSFTIERAIEGTTGFAFSSGDAVEMRLTAGEIADFIQLNNLGNTKGTYAINIQTNRTGATDVASGAYSMVIGTGANIASATDSIAIGKDASSITTSAISMGSNADAYGGNHAISIGHGSKAKAIDTVALGYNSSAGTTNSIAIGKAANVTTGLRGIAIGDNSSSTGDYGVTLGYSTVASAVGSVAIGRNASSAVLNSISIGKDASTPSGDGTIAIGDSAYANVLGSVSIGSGSYTKSTKSLAIGYNAQTNNAANNAVALGYNTDCTGANFSTALGSGASCLANYCLSIGGGATNTVGKTVNITFPIAIRDNGAAPETTTAFQRVQRHTGAIAVIATEAIDGLTTSNTEIQLPTDFFIEEVGVVCADYSSVSVQPTVAFGKSASTTEWLAATITTAITAVGKRHRFTSPLLDDTAGTTMFCRITTAGTGTTLELRFYVKGWFMTSSTTNYTGGG